MPYSSIKETLDFLVSQRFLVCQLLQVSGELKDRSAQPKAPPVELRRGAGVLSSAICDPTCVESRVCQAVSR